ncbi:MULTISPECIES: MarR family winged helix-turn-helix transcriptional regulator [Paenibacillus]|uniref:MarR family transcriptional regulator n=1 Tax=Paenibacillus alvei TaxID=44250 RepID=A0ABT4E7C8_PAEAL|nr:MULTISPECIES: MarR family transcriptional regulator [Paenibacillus]EPY14449.1 MarR family transcriptional regulator [Paenibacillus alvei A6-6i-x]MCY9528276.1 MarR family transcriptional regulator [Paenibacillus alvei]SDE29964.1 DNA-binding transcriptional regulator, MarR family [Paenibacillus sp. cl6col]
MKRDAKTVIERYIAAEFTVVKHLFNEIGEAIPNHLTIDQYQIMCVLHQRGQCTSTDLAAVFKVVKSSITAIINRLVDHGYVERTPAEEDRRVIELSLTEEGQMVYEQVDKQVQDIVSSYLTHFNETEVETFIGTYEKLARLMTEGKNQT